MMKKTITIKSDLKRTDIFIPSCLNPSESHIIEAFGIGESPFGLQGTFSIWRNEASIKDFAFKGAAHVLVIRQTHEVGWYSEELFARFKVVTEAE